MSQSSARHRIQVPPDFTCDLNALYASLMKDDPLRYPPTTYTDYLGYMRPADDGGPGSGPVCPFGYNGDGSCVYGPVYVPPTFKCVGAAADTDARPDPEQAAVTGRGELRQWLCGS